jgi:hypothetical protein
MTSTGKDAGGFTGAMGPVAAGQISNSQKWPPIVGGAVVQFIGYIGIGVGGQRFEVAFRPPRCLPA